MFRAVFDYFCRYYKTTLGLSSVIISWYQTSSMAFDSVRTKFVKDIAERFLKPPCLHPYWIEGAFFEAPLVMYPPVLTAAELKSCLLNSQKNSPTVGEILWNVFGGVKSVTASQCKQYLITVAQCWNVLLSYVIIDNFRLISQRIIFLFQFTAVDVSSRTLITEIVKTSISVIGLAFSILKQASHLSLLSAWLGFGSFVNLTNPFVVWSAYLPLICSIGESSLDQIFQWFGLRQNTVITRIGQVIPVPDYFPPAISPFGEESLSVTTLSPIGAKLYSVLGKPIFDNVAYCVYHTSIVFKRVGGLFLIGAAGIDGG